MESRYITIIDESGLKDDFLRYVSDPLDSIVESVEAALDMWPDGLRVTLVLLPNIDAVSRTYFDLYKKVERYKAFISLSRKTIYLSVQDINRQILYHELAHAIVGQFFTERPPYKIHELLAQYAERNIKK